MSKEFNPPKQELIIPEGFTPWHGGYWTGNPEDDVEYVLRDGYIGRKLAKNVVWTNDKIVQYFDIIAYKIVKKYQPKTVDVAALRAMYDSLEELNNLLAKAKEEGRREAACECAALCDQFGAREMHPKECADAIRLLYYAAPKPEGEKK